MTTRAAILSIGVAALDVFYNGYFSGWLQKTEVDAINGVVSNFGRKVGVSTPMNDKVVEIIHRIEDGELAPSFDNLQYFK